MNIKPLYLDLHSNPDVLSLSLKSSIQSFCSHSSSPLHRGAREIFPNVNLMTFFCPTILECLSIIPQIKSKPLSKVYKILHDLVTHFLQLISYHPSSYSLFPSSSGLLFLKYSNVWYNRAIIELAKKFVRIPE